MNGHPHEEMVDILPFDIKVESYCNKKASRCKNGDEILIQFVIYNLGKQVVTSLVIEDEGCPFIVIRRETRLDLQERGIAVCEVRGVIKANAGTYNATFKFMETSVGEVIGPKITIEFHITEGLFSSIFKGSR